MKSPTAALLLCCAAVGSATLIRQHGKDKLASGNAARDVSPVDPKSWGVLDLMSEMNTDIMRLSRSLNQWRSFLQISSSLTTSPKAAAAPGVAKPAATKPATAAPAAVKSKASSKAAGFDVQEAVTQMSNMGPSQMPAMLGLLKGMYSSWKDKIGTANKREKDEKKEFEAEVKSLELKKKKFKNDVNATKTYDNIEKYWKRQREISHRQYHTVLKLAHSGMEKFKSVMGAMEGAIKGKKPSQETMKKIQSMEMPEVVLLQKLTKLSQWTRGAMSLLRDAQNPYPGMKGERIAQLPRK